MSISYFSILVKKLTIFDFFVYNIVNIYINDNNKEEFMDFTLPKTKKAREKFDRIIAAADQHIYQYGFEKASIANITASADVATGTFYLYFKDKRELDH